MHDLNELELFNLLENQCHGRAKAMISSLSVVNQTYKKAKEILLSAFAEETPQKFALITQLTELNFSWGVDDPFLYYAEFKKIVDSAKDLKIDVNCIMSYFIWNGLPSKFQDIMVAITNKAHPDLSDITSKFLEASNRYLIKVNQSSVSESTSLVASTSDNIKTDKNKCILCYSLDHYVSKCSKYVSVEEKVARIKELKLCLKCFNSDHFSRDCNFVPSGKCVKCKNGRHWSFLCSGNNDRVNNKSHKPAKMFGNNSKGTDVRTSSNAISSQLDIADLLLPLLTVLSKNRCYEARVNTVLDVGSQNSFITNELADKLCLKIVDPSINLFMTGINSSQKFRTKSVEFPVQVGDMSYNVICICIPKINIRIKTPQLDKLLEMTRKHDIPLAYDPFVKNESIEEVSNIECLIGARDWSIVANMQSGTVGSDNVSMYPPRGD